MKSTHSSKNQHPGSLADEQASLAVEDSFAKHQAGRRIAERQRVVRNRRLAAVGAVAITVTAIGAAEVIPVIQNKSHEMVVEQNDEALKNAKGIVNGQLWISKGTRIYGAPDTAKDSAGEKTNNAQAVGEVPEGGYSVIAPIEYDMDGQAWYGFVDPITQKSETNPAEKIHWVSGQALNTKDDNGHYLANWEGGLIPDLKGTLGFDKTGIPMDIASPKEANDLSKFVAYVDNLPNNS